MLPLVVHAWNTSVTSSHGLTPHKALFGTDSLSPVDFELPRLTEDFEDGYPAQVEGRAAKAAAIPVGVVPPKLDASIRLQSEANPWRAHAPGEDFAEETY